MKLTLITKSIILFLGIGVISILAILLPELAREEAVSNPNAGPAYPFLIAAWILSLPIFAALYQALKLCNYLDQNQAFTTRSLNALQTVRNCAVIFSTLIIIGAIAVITWVKMIDPTEDVTPIVTIGVIFVFVSSVIATFVALIQRLLQDVITMKSDNELTV